MINQVDLSKCTINGIRSYFLEYYNMIENHGWIVGQDLKRELDNLIEDLENYDYKQKYAHFRIYAGQKIHKQTKNKFHGKLIEFMKWQKAFLEVLYSFYLPGTNERRFKEALLLVARKNGKSTLIADDLLIDLFFGDGGQDICVSSNDDSQADLIYQEIDNARIMIDPFNEYTNRNQKGITHKKSKSRIFKISDRTRNKEGRNITKASIDEIHEMKDNEIAMAIRQSTSIGDNTLVIQISTEGIVDNGYLDKELVRARQIINKEIDDLRILPWLYTQDSHEEVFQDSTSWWKSNPSLGKVKKLSYMKDVIAKAQVSREDRPSILCKDFNIKQNNSVSWLIEEEISKDQETVNLEDFKGSYYIGGVDLSETTDLTAVFLLFQKNKKVHFHKMYFIPESKARGDAQTNLEKMNYYELAAKGIVTIVLGNEINSMVVNKYLEDLYKHYKIRPFKVGYDNWMAKDFTNKLIEYFGEEVPERVRMDFTALSTPMRSLGADLRDGYVNYGGDEVTKSCLRNTAVKTNNIGQIMPIKIQGNGIRIDGTLGMLIAYHVRWKYRSEFDALIVGE